MAGFQILKDNTKQNSILRIEGICPCCGHYPSIYKELIPQKMKTRQFKYTCTSCRSEWVGNIYDVNLNIL